ncbi:MAG: tetratricopeptide repeat protein [Bacteroidetes bacterium]|nr:tetratricopeptide repeat protein [Bacteroidota bacterium]
MQHINAIPFKKKIIPFIAFILFILSVKVTKAQKKSSKLDSLLQAAQMPQHDTLLIFSYSRLAQELRNSNTDSANKYADKAIALSEKIKFTRGSVMSLYSKGLVLLMESKHQEAVGYFEQSKQHISSTGTEFMLPEYYNGCASAHDRLGNKSKALEMYLESARLFESENNDRKAAAAYNNISAIYRKDLNDADNALVYAKNRLRFYKILPSTF